MLKKPFIATRELVVFPGVVTPIFIGRQASLSSLEEALSSFDNKLILSTQKDPNVEDPKLPEDVYETGVLVHVIQTVKMPNGNVKVLVEAKHRVLIGEFEEKKGVQYADYEEIFPKPVDESKSEALKRRVIDEFSNYAKITQKILPDVIYNIKEVRNIDKAFDLICTNLMIATNVKQELLEILDVEERAYKILSILEKEIEIFTLEREIENKVKEQMAEVQKNYYLREKIKAMREEMGEDSDSDEELEELDQRVQDSKIPKELKEKMVKELSRLKKMPDFSAEASVIRSYVETVLELPWDKSTKDEIDIEKAEREYDFEKLSELRYGKLANLELKLAELNEKKKEKESYLKEEVTEETIAEVISKWTNIPIKKLVEGEKEKLLHLGDILHKRVVGQDEAIDLVRDCILRSRSGLKDENKPIGSFIFLGPTGVGKTELAKTLCESMFDSEKNLVRIDMSEYMEKHSVSRLIGAPPGYVGYDEGGQLTERVRRNPYCVILFDEIEKAHPDVFNILLQVLDDGRLTDNQGRVVDFKNTIIIMTSNIGSTYLLDGIDENGKITKEAENEVMKELKNSFRPEFLNRVDDIVLFKPLQKEELYKIIDMTVSEIENRLKDIGVKINLDEDCKKLILDSTYSFNYGARIIKRYIQKNIETEIATKIIEGKITPNSTINFKNINGKICIS